MSVWSARSKGSPLTGRAANFLGLLFVEEKTVDDKDDTDHDDSQSEYGKWGGARACVKTREIVRGKL